VGVDRIPEVSTLQVLESMLGGFSLRSDFFWLVLSRYWSRVFRRLGKPDCLLLRKLARPSTSQQVWHWRRDSHSAFLARMLDMVNWCCHGLTRSLHPNRQWLLDLHGTDTVQG